MTNRERFYRIYDFKSTGRPPRWETPTFWSETLENWTAAGTFPANADPMEYYGIEPTPRTPSPILISKTSFTPPFEEEIIEQDGALVTFKDEFVCVGQLPESELSRKTKSVMPHWVKFPGDSPKNWEENVKWRLDPEKHGYCCNIEEECKKLQDNPDPNGLLICGLYAFWRNMWGMEKLAYAFYDYPDTIHDMTRTGSKGPVQFPPK